MNSIISDLMSSMRHMTLSLLRCVAENHMVSLVIMILGILRMQLGWLVSGMPRKRSLCMSAFAARCLQSLAD